MTEIGATSSQNIRSDYLKLLVTQLQNQNPLEPMDNDQMTMQLAQLSQLEQTENLRVSFDKVLASEQRSQALAMMGKEISFFPKDGTTLQTGRVGGLDVSAGGVKLQVGNFSVMLDEIQDVRD